MRYKLSPHLRLDLAEIGDWIAQDNPRRAISFLHELREEIRRVAQNPEHYQLRPDIGEDARVAVYGRYVILFYVDGNMVRFERVVFGGRDLPTMYQ